MMSLTGPAHYLTTLCINLRRRFFCFPGSIDFSNLSMISLAHKLYIMCDSIVLVDNQLRRLSPMVERKQFFICLSVENERSADATVRWTVMARLSRQQYSGTVARSWSCEAQGRSFWGLDVNYLQLSFQSRWTEEFAVNAVLHSSVNLALRSGTWRDIYWIYLRLAATRTGTDPDYRTYLGGSWLYSLLPQ